MSGSNTLFMRQKLGLIIGNHFLNALIVTARQTRADLAYIIITADHVQAIELIRIGIELEQRKKTKNG